MICSICLESLCIVEARCIKTKCGHYFHWDCMTKWFRIRHDCPSCRAIVRVHDCVLMESSCITCPEGIYINHLKFYPNHLQDFSFVLIYLFFLQHSYLISEIPSTTESKISAIVQSIVDHACHDKLLCWTYCCPDFYREKSLYLNVEMVYDIHTQIHSLHMDDIRYLFQNDRNRRRPYSLLKG